MKTCPKAALREREVGLHDHIEQDIALYFRGGADYLKVDGCGLRDFGVPGESESRSGP
jgi:hypothetical protein